MTYDNQQETIDECYVAANPDVIKEKIQTAMKKLQDGGTENMIASGLDMIIVLNQFPATLSTCKS